MAICRISCLSSFEKTDASVQESRRVVVHPVICKSHIVPCSVFFCEGPEIRLDIYSRDNLHEIQGTASQSNSRMWRRNSTHSTPTRSQQDTRVSCFFHSISTYIFPLGDPTINRISFHVCPILSVFTPQETHTNIDDTTLHRIALEFQSAVPLGGRRQNTSQSTLTQRLWFLS